MQDTGNEIFWAGHNSTSQMRIFSLAEGSGTYFWRDVNIGSWSNTGLSSTTPDNNDWLTKLRGFPGNAVIGATRAFGPPSKAGELFSDGLWFAWSAGTDSNFQQPHVEMVTLDRANNFALVQQVQIWNNSYAFVYPALATNGCTGEVGLSFEYGGNGNYENHVVGFWGDFIAYITTNSQVGTTRYGDYVTIRQDPTPSLNGAFFDAFGYGLNSPSAGQTGTQTDVRYVQFGRPGRGLLFPSPKLRKVSVRVRTQLICRADRMMCLAIRTMNAVPNRGVSKLKTGTARIAVMTRPAPNKRSAFFLRNRRTSPDGR